jgi:uncharacterized protein (TIGR02996 family)
MQSDEVSPTMPSRTRQQPPFHPQELAFHQAIVESPGDDGTWLVLADWLEEHDDPRRAELLRLHRRLLATCCEPEQHPERAVWQARLVELLAEGVRPPVPQQAVSLGKRVKVAFSWIPPGRFLMGSPPSEEGRMDDEALPHPVLVDGFWLATQPLTQAQWQTVAGRNPSHFQTVKLPVDSVSWNHCLAFCDLLAGVSGKRYRLPTEAEWEWACRAGTTTPFFFGHTIRAGQANFNGIRGQTTRPGSFPANAWGLADMHGNLWEWCEDHHHAGGTARVLRGGCWHNRPSWCRSARRLMGAPSYDSADFGCRLVCMD